MVAFKLSIPHTKLEAVNWSRQLGPQPKDWIVLHAMQWPERGNSAEWCARFFAGLEGPAPRSSANFCVDADSIVESVPAERVAWHAPGANQRGIGIEHAGYAKQTRAEWLDDYGRRMLELSARLTAELCQHFGIPPRFVDAEDLRAKCPGITTHAECTRAWPEKGGSHTDPGPGFPMREYLEMVNAQPAFQVKRAT